MTKQEFENRTGVIVSATEYQAIEAVYMNSDLEKDEFCALWSKMNYKRVAKASRLNKAEVEMQRNREVLYSVLYKSCESKDFNKLADNFFNKTEKKSLAKIGIKMQQENCGIPYFVTVASVLYDLQKYFKIA